MNIKQISCCGPRESMRACQLCNAKHAEMQLRCLVEPWVFCCVSAHSCISTAT